MPTGRRRPAPPPDGAQGERWLTTEEIADHLGCPRSWIFNNAEKLGMPRARLGSTYRYRASEVDAWLCQRQGGPETTGPFSFAVRQHRNGAA